MKAATHTSAVQRLEEPQAAASLEHILNHHLKQLGITDNETVQLNEILLRRLSNGRALLLFDGLDEITHRGIRAKFCRQVEQIHVAYPYARTDHSYITDRRLQGNGLANWARIQARHCTQPHRRR